jgi:hypothetical protein
MSDAGGLHLPLFFVVTLDELHRQSSELRAIDIVVLQTESGHLRQRRYFKVLKWCGCSVDSFPLLAFKLNRVHVAEGIAGGTANATGHLQPGNGQTTSRPTDLPLRHRASDQISIHYALRNTKLPDFRRPLLLRAKKKVKKVKLVPWIEQGLLESESNVIATTLYKHTGEYAFFECILPQYFFFSFDCNRGA